MESIINVRISTLHKQAIDKLVKQGHYASESEFVREAIRFCLRDIQKRSYHWDEDKQRCVPVLGLTDV